MTGPYAPLTKRGRYELLRTQLENARTGAGFDDHWRDIGDHLFPRRARFTVSDTNRGNRRSSKIIDSTATYACETAVAGIMSGASSQARPWFRLTAPDPDLSEVASVKEWLHTVTQRMQWVFSRSNLYDALPSLYRDLLVYGTSAMSVEEDFESIIRCQTFPVGSYYVANDDRLDCRVFMRKYQRTVRQIVGQFGTKNGGEGEDWSKFSLRVQNAWREGRTEEWIELVHLIQPNEDADENRLESKYKAFSSCYYEAGNSPQGSITDPFLEEMGFPEFPILCARWDCSGEDVYATNCPGMTALGDIKQLQHGEKRAGQLLDKLTDPPLVAPPEARTVKITSLHGEISYVADRQGSQGLRPLHEVQFNAEQLEYKQAQKRDLIKQAFYADLFLALLQSDARTRTAREVEELSAEKLTVLGPLMGRLDKDVFSPLIDRTFAIMTRFGMIPEPPEELQGHTLKVEYLSIMAQAQKMVGLAGTERFTNYVLSIAAVDPSILDKANLDEAVDSYGDMAGVAPKVVRSDEEVAAIRNARAQQQEQMQQAEMLKTAGQGTQALSQSDTGSKNALTDLISQTEGVPS